MSPLGEGTSMGLGARCVSASRSGGEAGRRWLASVEVNLRGDEEENGGCRVFTSWRLIQENGLLGLHKLAADSGEWAVGFVGWRGEDDGWLLGGGR